MRTGGGDEAGCRSGGRQAPDDMDTQRTGSYQLTVRPNGSARIACRQCQWEDKARTAEAAVAKWTAHDCDAQLGPLSDRLTAATRSVD